MPDDEALATYYRSGSYWGHVAEKTPFDIPTYHHQARARLAFIQSNAALPEQPRVLDIGAGYGVLEETLRAAYPYAELFAVEPDPKAQSSLHRMGVRTASDLTAFKGQTFDLLILSHVLEHMNRPVSYLQSLQAFCHETSVLFIEVPHEDHLFKVNLEPHALFFAPASLSRILSQAGCGIAALATCGAHRGNQKNRNRLIDLRQRIVARIPFREPLKRLKRRFLEPKRPILKGDSALPPDSYECAVYGPDRIWIRCLAWARGGKGLV